MIYRVEVSVLPGMIDARGVSILRDIATLGVQGVTRVTVVDLYFLRADEPSDAHEGLDAEGVQRLVDILLCDSVVQQARWYPVDGDGRHQPGSEGWTVEVTLHPGVTDSVADSLLQGARMIGVSGLAQAASGRRYLLTGDMSEVDAHRVAGSLLANEVIQHFYLRRPAPPPFVHPTSIGTGAAVETIPLTQADSSQLLAISSQRRLSLDLAEMQAIQAYYRLEGREPTDVELEMLAQTWSEHCVHKTFKAVIEYSEPAAGSVEPVTGDRLPVTDHRIDGLLKTYIWAATEQAAKPWVRSAFVDNAGIVTFDESFDLAFKVETHNHPSALEPFGGANTGVGGVVRDVVGVSARPIANTDILCFGPLDLGFDDLPSGVLHPRRISDGVIAGIEDYGNKMGIPTVNGAILYDPGYTANPLVFCGCLGILPRGAHRTEAQVGDLVVVIGGRTGRDGLRGATFSSMEMNHETSEVAGSAVQIGDPIQEKRFLEAVLIARDEGLYNAITDCGAGGLSSAVGEMGAQLGAEVHLERVPLKYPGLRPWEIWLSEAQERMVLAVPPTHWDRLQQICAGLDVEATALGTFTGQHRLHIYYAGQLVGDLDVDFLHNGIPRRQLVAEWRPPQPSLASAAGLPLPGSDLTDTLLALLAMPDTRSKEETVRQYDHEVQGGTVVKPLVGAGNHGPGDAAVLAPLDVLRTGDLSSSQSPDPVRGVALSVGVNPQIGAVDPYLMAWACVDEAIRNAVAVGADPDQVSLLDNFSWGNPSLPDRLGSLVRCARGCYDAAVAYGAPFISGKDSLNNEYTGIDGRKHAIPGTLVISALGMVPDVHRTVTMDLKRAGNWLYMVGLTQGELAGSSYGRHLVAVAEPPAALAGEPGGAFLVPGPEASWAEAPRPPQGTLELYRALHRAITQGLVQSCHDCSEGGLAVAAAEMALAGRLGLDVDLARVLRGPEVDRDDGLTFCESLGRLLVEVRPSHSDAFEALLRGLPLARMGRVRQDGLVRFTGLQGQPVIETDVESMGQAWQGHLAKNGAGLEARPTV